MTLQPKNIELAESDTVRIEWSDGMCRVYRYRELRESCPCATCREIRRGEGEPSSALPVLAASEIEPLKLTGMTPVGHYAYKIEFSDGHDTGIYPLEMLRELGREIESEAS